MIGKKSEKIAVFSPVPENRLISSDPVTPQTPREPEGHFSGSRGVCGVTVLRLIGFSGTESVFDGGAGLFQRILQRFPQLRHKPVVDPAAADFEPDGELLRR